MVVVVVVVVVVVKRCRKLWSIAMSGSVSANVSTGLFKVVSKGVFEGKLLHVSANNK